MAIHYLGKKLKTWRKAKGMSQAEVALVIGVNPFGFNLGNLLGE